MAFFSVWQIDSYGKYKTIIANIMFFVSSDRVDKKSFTERVNYQKFPLKITLSLNSFIIKELRECVEKYHFKINAIGIDPHNADGILSELETFCAPVVIVTQSARNLNDSTMDIQTLVKSKRYFYNKKNELLAYSFMNAETVSNSFDEIKIDKPADMANRRIYPTDAVIDAHYCHIKDKKERQTDVNAELEFYLKMIGGDNNV